MAGFGFSLFWPKSDAIKPADYGYYRAPPYIGMEVEQGHLLIFGRRNKSRVYARGKNDYSVNA